MRSHRLVGALVVVALTSVLPAPASAQWFNHQRPGVPRLADGKPDLSAPTPRTADGKPDLSGIWSGAGPMYRFNIAQDLNAEDIKPWAEALFLQRVRESRKDSPLAKCMPVSLPYHQFFNLTRLVQTPTMVLVQPESHGVHRRARSSERSESDVHGVLDRAMGGRHAGGDDRRLQRQGLAR